MILDPKPYTHPANLNIKICVAFLVMEFFVSIIAAIFGPGHVHLNISAIGLAPFTQNHPLGTDQLGRDVLLQLFIGLPNTYLLSFLGVTLAAASGIALGSSIGYFGDRSFRVNQKKLVLTTLFTITFVYYIFQYDSFNWSLTIDILLPLTIIAFLILLFNFLLKKKNKNLVFPIDIVFTRLVEIYTTLPPVFIIILFSAIIRPSPFLFVIYCLLSMWPEFYMLSRSEILKVKNYTFVDAAIAIGQKNRWVIFRHILPNTVNPLLVLFAFGFARLLVIESTLSFLGIGLPIEYPGWGKLILSFRHHTDYWWLLVFPGLLIFINVYCIQKTGRFLQRQ